MAWQLDLLVFRCVSRGCTNAQDWGKKKKTKVKKTTQKNSEGAQGGAQGWRSRGLHREGLRQDLAMARVLQLHKGVQGGAWVVRGGGQGAEHTKSGEEKEKKKDIKTHTKTQVAHRVVHVQSSHGQAVCGGGLASSTR